MELILALRIIESKHKVSLRAVKHLLKQHVFVYLLVFEKEYFKVDLISTSNFSLINSK